MKKLLPLVGILGVGFAQNVFADNCIFPIGDGTADDPYEINTIGCEIENTDKDQYYQLGRDLRVSIGKIGITFFMDVEKNGDIYFDFDNNSLQAENDGKCLNKEDCAPVGIKVVSIPSDNNKDADDSPTFWMQDSKFDITAPAREDNANLVGFETALEVVRAPGPFWNASFAKIDAREFIVVGSDDFDPSLTANQDEAPALLSSDVSNVNLQTVKIAGGKVAVRIMPTVTIGDPRLTDVYLSNLYINNVVTGAELSGINPDLLTDSTAKAACYSSALVFTDSTITGVYSNGIGAFSCTTVARTLVTDGQGIDTNGIVAGYPGKPSYVSLQGAAVYDVSGNGVEFAPGSTDNSMTGGSISDNGNCDITLDVDTDCTEEGFQPKIDPANPCDGNYFFGNSVRPDRVSHSCLGGNKENN